MWLLTPLLAVPLASFAPTAPTGNAYHVGPTRTYATIDSAVTAAASGDVILVDPGSYPPFSIDGKGLSVLADAGTFTVVEGASSVPAVSVQNLAFGEQVTISGVRVAHGVAADAPAIHLRNNRGAVKLNDVRVTMVSDMIATSARGVIQVEATDPVWLSDVWVRAGAAGPFAADRAGAVGWSEAVSGVYLLDSNAVLKNCRILGYDAGLTYAGDGLRIEGDSFAWLIDNFVNSPTQSSYEGGSGDYGGSAIQGFGSNWRMNRVTVCGLIKYEPGAGITQAGGIYAINGDGSIVGGALPTRRRPDTCSPNDYSETTVGAVVVSLGTDVVLNLRSAATVDYFAIMSLNTDYRRHLYRLWGRSVIDMTPGQVFVAASGRLSGSIKVEQRYPVPLNTGLIGTQLTFQMRTKDVQRPTWSGLSMPSFVVLRP